jgi:alpha-glucoside transport system substrate-binding protein
VQIAQGQFLTPHLQANPEAYATDTMRALGEILTSATVFRFDGSDLMPGEIGTSAFWTGMVDYTTGASAEEVAGAVQRRWESLRQHRSPRSSPPRPARDRAASAA